MIIIHSTQKLLNTSHLKPVLYISQPTEKQLLHSWYARLLSTGISGKFLVMYVHQPSLMTILCKGKTIQGTWMEFTQRLTALLQRSGFPKSYIEWETKHMNGYVVSKTASKSMLAHMNQMVATLKYHIYLTGAFESMSQDFLEDLMMDHLHSSAKNEYTTPSEFWKKTIEALN